MGEEGVRDERENVNEQFQRIQLRFLGYYFIDMGSKTGIRFCDLCADGALDGGFDFAFGAGGDAARL